jgi:hypothetical protein
MWVRMERGFYGNILGIGVEESHAGNWQLKK